MKASLRNFLVLLLLSSALSAADFTAKIVDGLRRPVPGVNIEVYCHVRRSGSKSAEVKLLRLRSDSQGMARGAYSPMPGCEEIRIDLKKAGYSGYSAYGRQREYILLRSVRAEDLHRVATLAGPAQQAELRELLAGDWEAGDAGPMDRHDLVFFYGRRLRPALLFLAEDPQVGAGARDMLAFIGVPADVRWLVQHAPPRSREALGNRWAYAIASALLEPSDEGEWAFLRKCAFNEYDDGWVDFAAILALRLIASPRSVEILKQAREKNKERAELIDGALERIRSSAPVLAHPDLEEAAKRVAQAIEIGNWNGNAKPRHNEQGDMALVDCQFISGRDRLTYTATFHNVEGVWRLRGLRETMQAMMPAPPPLPPPPEL